MTAYLFLKSLSLVNLLGTAFAQSGGGTNPPLTNPLCPSGSPNCPVGFDTVLGRVLDNVITLAVPVVGIMVLVGGFQIMTAQGNKEKVTSGRHTITYAVIGFAIILMAKSAALIVKSIIG